MPVLACDPADFVVAIDVGHTRKAPGAISARGIPELELNLALAATLQATLHADGFTKGFLINAEGRIGSLNERTRKAAHRNANLFVSIHHDSVQPRYLKTWTVDGKSRRYSDRFRGYSLFVSAKNPHFDDSLHLASFVGRAFRARGLTPSLHHAEPIKGESRLLLDEKLGIYRIDDLIVLKTARMPALLVEAGVILHRDEEEALRGPARRQLLAAGIVAGVRAFCTKASTEAPVPPN